MATSVPAGKAEKAQASAAVALADMQDKCWTRVEAWKKAMSPQDGLSKLQTTVVAADTTTSDAVMTSATGNSSPVTERTTEDELPSGLDGTVCCVLTGLMWHPCARFWVSSPRRGLHGSARGLVHHDGVALRR
ncbi:hypothetical protein EDB85DRAFT_1889475 [Lactarius pseudohatsudake]|nr:hypothetical protein EDB85DRAFT_1889475 [Lactarius pseudohatsudake]